MYTPEMLERFGEGLMGVERERFRSAIKSLHFTDEHEVSDIVGNNVFAAIMKGLEAISVEDAFRDAQLLYLLPRFEKEALRQHVDMIQPADPADLFSRVKKFGFSSYGPAQLDFAIFERFPVGTVIAEGQISLITGPSRAAGDSEVLTTDNGLRFYDNMLFRGRGGRVRLIRGQNGFVVESMRTS